MYVCCISLKNDSLPWYKRLVYKHLNVNYRMVTKLQIEISVIFVSMLVYYIILKFLHFVYHSAYIWHRRNVSFLIRKIVTMIDPRHLPRHFSSTPVLVYATKKGNFHRRLQWVPERLNKLIWTNFPSILYSFDWAFTLDKHH